MKKVALVSLSLLAIASVANAASVGLELRWNGVPGAHELTLNVSQEATIELWGTVAGDTLVGCNIAWDIAPFDVPDFTIVSREINPGFYQAGVNNGFPAPGTAFRGLYTTNLAGALTGEVLLEKYTIHCDAISEDIISVVGSNPNQPLQTLSFVNAAGTAFTYTLPAPLTLHQVPEPASLALLALGGLLAIRRR